MNKWLFILLLPFMAFAQEVEVEPGIWKIPMNRFTGLNTIAGDRIIKSNEARIAHEIDFSRNGPGTISKRYGYDSVGTVTEVDTLVAIKSMQFQDGSKYLVVIGKDTDSSFGVVYTTNEGSDAMDSLNEGSREFPILQKPSFAKLDDKLFVASGVGRGLVWNGDVWRDWPPPAPGEPKIVPIGFDTDTDPGDTTSFYLDGSYSYTFKAAHSLGSNPFDEPGYISRRVKVKQGRVLITNMQWFPGDSLTNDTAVHVTDDTTIIYIYRSKGDYGRLERSDSAWYIGRLMIHATDTGLANDVFIDSIPDDSLTGATLPMVLVGQEQAVGRGTDGAYNHRYGAPGYDSSITWTTADTTDDGDTISPYWGWPSPEGIADAVGIAYACTFIDTVTGVESDIGPPLVVFKTNFVKSYRLTLPRPAAGERQGLAINLYRAPLRGLVDTNLVHTPRSESGYIYCYDSLGRQLDWARFTSAEDRYIKEHTMDPTGLKCDQIWVTYDYLESWKAIQFIDSFYIDQYRLLAQITDSGTTEYSDTTTYTDWEGLPAYLNQQLPNYMDYLFSYQRWLYAIDGSSVYRSEVGNPNSWNIFEDAVDVGKGDGDQVTAAWITRTLRIAKNYSTYNVEPSLFEDAELVSNWGCIAPGSVVSAPPGVFYLSANGVILETEGLYLERTYQSPLISSKLDNFSKLSMVSRKRAVGMWIHDQAQYWICIGDTTYVYDWRASRDLGEPVWSTSSVKIGGATSFDTDDELEFMPGRTAYFWKPSTGIKNKIYKFGTNETDDGNYVPIAYLTGPLGWGDGLSQILRVGITISGTSDSASVWLIVRDNFDSTLTTIAVDSLTKRFRGYEMIVAPELYYNMGLHSYGTTYYLTGDTYIDQIDFYYMKNSEPYIWR